jgi:hypothetical protein
VSSYTEQKTEMHTKRSDVSTSFARDPEYRELTIVVEFDEFALVDCAYSQLSLDSGDERWSLEDCASQCFECAGQLGLAARQLLVQSQYTDVFLSCSLLALHQSSSTIDTDDQTSSDLGIKGTRVTSAVDAKDSFHPCHNFVRGGI